MVAALLICRGYKCRRPMPLASGLLMLAALAGCQPNQPKQTAQPPKPTPPPATTPLPAAKEPAQLPPYTSERQMAMEALTIDKGCTPQPLRFAPLTTGPRPHRYQGTVGNERATAELSWSRPDSVTGSFYLWRHGPEYQLKYSGRPQGPFVFSLSHEYPDFSLQDGTWHLTAPLGPVLRGVWVDSAGQRRAVVLHESYADGVPYEIQSLMLTGGKPESGGVAGFACSVPDLTREYIHLLAPAASRPVLRQLQAPTLAVRRRQLRKEYDRAATSVYGVRVRLNGFQLLSYATYYEAMPFGGRRQDEVIGTLLDLRTGRKLPLGSQLAANYRPHLRHLIAQHLLHDANFNFAADYPDFKWIWQSEPTRPGAAPDTAFSTSLWTQRELAPLTNKTILTSEGLELTYWLGGLSNMGSIMPDQTVLIPYHELRSLVRPGTPLARMLMARGLW